jgi:hypothetical protein
MSEEENPKKAPRSRKLAEKDKKPHVTPWTEERKAVNKSETIAIKAKMAAMAVQIEKSRGIGGRYTEYNSEIGKKFCRKLSQEPLSVEAICNKYPDEFPTQSCIFGWIVDFPEFEGMYREAKRAQMHLYVEQIIDISDGSDDDFVDQVKIQHSKLRIDTRKWVASKLAPRIYGDTPKIDERTSQETLMALQETIAALIAKNAKDY